MGSFSTQCMLFCRNQWAFLTFTYTECITDIVEFLEVKYRNKQVGLIVAMGLCLGWNDFLPEFHGQSHSKVLSAILENEK